MIQNILITGANGQLGNEVSSIFSDNADYMIFRTDVAELDITDYQAIESYIHNNKIDYVINCAAYTAVDAAEDNMDLCFKLNVKAVENIARAAKTENAKVIHISTDYVFDGYNYHPYTEDERTNPKSVYGTTKLEGEKTLFDITPDSIVIRTAWMYSIHGKNFVKTMMKLGAEKESLNVVSDQIGTPTYAPDLANAIYAIITSDKWTPGIYHFSNEGAISWYDFTKAIFRICEITSCSVSPILSKDYPTKANRPFYSVLDKSKIKQTYNLTIPYWEESLEKCIQILKQNS